MTPGRGYSMCLKNVSTYLMRKNLVSSLTAGFEIIVFLFPIKNEMGGACGMYGKRRNAYTVWWENLRERKLGRPRRRWEDDIKWFLNKLFWGWTGLVWLRIETTGGLLLTR